MLKTHRRKFKGLLVKLNKKQEWGVKIHLEHEKFVEFLKKENEEVKKLEQKKSTMSEGGQWYADKKIEESIAAQLIALFSPIISKGKTIFSTTVRQGIKVER